MATKRKIVNKGYTNKEKYIEDGKFVIVKTHTGFNHKLNYALLDKFNFVPKLIENTDELIAWELLNADDIKNYELEDLSKLGELLHSIHNSSLEFPEFNIKDRVNKYLEVLKEKGEIVPEINNNLVIMEYVMKKMNKTTPIHCDLIHDNIMKDSSGKLWIVDWEYAIMGDKHFELAYLIQSSNLDKEQEEVLVNSYNEKSNDFEKINPEELNLFKRFCDWLTILWAHAQEEMPFDLTYIKERMNV